MSLKACPSYFTRSLPTSWRYPVRALFLRSLDRLRLQMRGNFSKKEITEFNWLSIKVIFSVKCFLSLIRSSTTEYAIPAMGRSTMRKTAHVVIAAFILLFPFIFSLNLLCKGEKSQTVIAARSTG